jgi:hypothetical protein
MGTSSELWENSVLLSKLWESRILAVGIVGSNSSYVCMQLPANFSEFGSQLFYQNENFAYSFLMSFFLFLTDTVAMKFS